MFSYIKTSLSAVLLTALLLQPSVMLAAALGEISVQSAIGQRLSAEIEIVGLSKNDADTIALRLAPPEAYKEAGLDYSAVLRSMRFNIEKKAERYVVRLSSEEVVNDPFITILFEIDTDGNRNIRQYALLLDPPAVDQQVAVTEPQTAVVPELNAAVVPVNSDAKETAPTAEVAATHTVNKGETLHGIASQLKPADTKLEQVLIALQRLNPNAIDGDNINRIKAGAVLTLPDAETIKAIDAADARKLVNAQTADFRRYREQLAQQARKPEASTEVRADTTTNRQSQGRVGVQVTEPTSKATQDKLRLSKAGAQGNSQSAANDAANMDKIAAEKALAEANDRVAALEKNVRDMSSLLDMKNQTLAAMQNQTKSAAAPAAAPTEATSAPIETKESTASSTTETQAAEKTEVKTEAEPASQSLVQMVEEKIKTDPLVTEMKSWKWDSAQFFNQDTAAYASAAAVMLLSLAFISSVVRRRRHPSSNVYDANPFLNERKTKAQSELGSKVDKAPTEVETKNSVFHSHFVPSVSQLDINEVDAVAEADAYIAYGRDKQAEEILLDALRTHPQRHALRVKLLEIHAGRQDKKKFAALAKELQIMSKGVGAEWEQAMRIGRILDPDNALYSAAKTSARTTQTIVTRNDSQDVLMRTEPSLKLVVSDTTVSKSSSVMEFDSRLEGMLAAHRKREIADGIPPIIDVEPHIGLDFPSVADQTRIRTEFVINDDRALTALRTKLDLALACQEIGDRDGARELLSEVASAENPELAKRAQSLLAQLA
jgi:pilus assembly protein FimV